MFLKKSGKVLPRVLYVLIHHHAIFIIVVLSNVCFHFYVCCLELVLFLRCSIQNLLESGSLNINPKLSRAQIFFKIHRHFSRYLEKWSPPSGQLAINSVSTKGFRLLKSSPLGSTENFTHFPPTALGNHRSELRRQLSKM